MRHSIPLSKNFRSMPYSLLMQSVSQITLISISLSYCFPFSSNVHFSGMFIFHYPFFLHASLLMKEKNISWSRLICIQFLPTYSWANRFDCSRCLNVNFSVALCTQTTDNFALWVWVTKCKGDTRIVFKKRTWTCNVEMNFNFPLALPHYISLHVTQQSNRQANTCHTLITFTSVTTGCRLLRKSLSNSPVSIHELAC